MKKASIKKLTAAILEDAGFTPCESLGEKIELGFSPDWYLFRRFPNRWKTIGRKIGLAHVEKYYDDEFSFSYAGVDHVNALRVKECSFFIVDLDFGLYSASHWLETLNLPNNVVKSLNVWQAGLAYQFESWGDIREMVFGEDSEWESKQLTEKQKLEWFFKTCLPIEQGKRTPTIWSKTALECFWESFTDEILKTEQSEEFSWVNEFLKAA